MTTSSTRNWIVDAVVGMIVGGIAGAILAVNIVIYAGPDQGYESSIADAFEHNTLAGLAVVAALVAGPVLGVVMARRMRQLRRRQQEVEAVGRGGDDSPCDRQNDVAR